MTPPREAGSQPEPIDPVWQRALSAPLTEEPETEEEKRMLEEALAGPRIPGHVVTAELAERWRGK